jgi:hypothetical protein
MKKALIKLCFLFMIASLLVPVNSALAYSYGDPTKEDVAETFNLIKTKLASSPADWSAALEAYKVRRAEISSHFGESVTVTLDHNFEMKEKDLVIGNYRYVLYLNLKRRFDYAEKDIEDYGKVKILLGKAKGTYDVLKPYVESKIPGEISKLDTAFEAALESIGNPGLFGMGKKPVNPEEFKKQTTYILSTLKPLFTYTKYTPEQQEPATQESNETKEEQKSTEQETTEQKEDSKDQQTAQQEQEKNTTQSTENESTSVSSNEQTKTVKEEENTDQHTDENPNQEKQQTEDNQTNEQAEESVTEENKAEETTVATTTQEQTVETKTEQKEAVDQKEESTSKQIASASTEHAPMEKTNKTNTVFTVLIIVGVLVVLSGGIWFARRKNFI